MTRLCNLEIDLIHAALTAKLPVLQVILAFVDNWVEGVDLYTGWAGVPNHVNFFTSSAVKQLYKDNVKALTGRVNTINGRKYSEDPTIFAWDLINEPRCDSDCPAGTIAVSSELAVSLSLQ